MYKKILKISLFSCFLILNACGVGEEPIEEDGIGGTNTTTNNNSGNGTGTGSSGPASTGNTVPDKPKFPPPVVSNIGYEGVKDWRSGVLVISANITSSGNITGNNLYVDNIETKLGSGNNNPVFQLDTATLSDGEHKVTIKSIDNEKQVGTSESITIKTDNTAPKVTDINGFYWKSGVAKGTVEIDAGVLSSASGIAKVSCLGQQEFTLVNTRGWKNWTGSCPYKGQFNNEYVFIITNKAYPAKSFQITINDETLSKEYKPPEYTPNPGSPD